MENVYTVFFTETDGMILIEVPDFEILTQGRDIAEAMDMARDAIGLKGISMQDNNEPLPTPSEFKAIELDTATFAENGTTFKTLVDVDFQVYRQQLDNISVRRNVTLPSWLNKEAENAGVNVSKILQEALKEKLNLDSRDQPVMKTIGVKGTKIVKKRMPAGIAGQSNTVKALSAAGRTERV